MQKEKQKIYRVNELPSAVMDHSVTELSSLLCHGVDHDSPEQPTTNPNPPIKDYPTLKPGGRHQPFDAAPLQAEPS